MFFGKAEKKRCHPCLVIMVGMLAVAGAVAITNKGKCLMSKAKSKLEGMWKSREGCDSGEGCD